MKSATIGTRRPDGQKEREGVRWMETGGRMDGEREKFRANNFKSQISQGRSRFKKNITYSTCVKVVQNANIFIKHQQYPCMQIYIYIFCVSKYSLIFFKTVVHKVHKVNSTLAPL